MKDLKKGIIVSHYKNPNRRYEILEIGLNNSNFEEVVIYKSLYQGEFKFGTIWVRPKKEFFEIVKVNGEKQPRFKIIDE